MKMLTTDLDTRPGRYYVSMVDGPQYALLLGPYGSHQEALDNVRRASDMAREVDAKYFWCGFGTCRLADDHPATPQGKLNNWKGATS